MQLTRARASDVWMRGRAIVTSTAHRFGRHQMTTHAAALAYRGALALFPFLLLVFGFVHAVGLEAIATSLAERAASGRPEDQGAFARWIGAQIEEPPDRSLLSIGILAALWAVAAGIRGLRLALAQAAEVVDAVPIPMWRRILLSIGFAPVAVIVIAAALLSLLVTSRAIITASSWLGGDIGLASMIAWLRVPVALFVIAFLLAGVYRMTPGVRQPFRAVLPGAIVASLLWTIMTLAFSAALATVLDYGATYGSFGAAIGLLVYLHLSAAVVLAGAEMNAVLRA